MMTHDEGFSRYPSANAQQRLVEHEVITLSNADRDQLLNLLEHPPAPLQDLCKLMHRAG